MLHLSQPYHGPAGWGGDYSPLPPARRPSWQANTLGIGDKAAELSRWAEPPRQPLYGPTKESRSSAGVSIPLIGSMRFGETQPRISMRPDWPGLRV